MSDFDFSKVTCDNIKFIPQKSQAVKDLEKEYEMKNTPALLCLTESSCKGDRNLWG